MSCTEIVWRVFLALLVGWSLTASATEPRTVAARAVQGEIVLDGILNEADWQGPAATGFTQREPAAGAPSTERTEVRIAYTPATLYVGIRAQDSEPRAGIFDFGPCNALGPPTFRPFNSRRIRPGSGRRGAADRVRRTPDRPLRAVSLGVLDARTSGTGTDDWSVLQVRRTYRPGADVFLVLNQRWDAPALGLRTVRDRQAILKLTYLIAV